MPKKKMIINTGKKYLRLITAFMFSVIVTANSYSAVITYASVTEYSASKYDREDVITSGNWEYIIDDRKAVITGYTGTDAEIVIPDFIDSYPVNAVGDNAFSDNSTITHAEFGKNIKELGERIFENCVSLKEITVPYSIEKTGQESGSFAGSSIEKITFEAGSVSSDQKYVLPKNACDGMSELKTVVLPASLGVIDDCAFRDCVSLEEFDLTQYRDLFYIGNDAFANCISIKEICIPSKKLLRTSPFSGSGIESVIFEDGMESIETGFFSGMNKLKKVYVPESLKIIEEYAFKGCGALETLNLQGTALEEIGCYAFDGCTSLESVILPKGLTRIEQMAFRGCASLSAADFRETELTETGSDAYSECTALKEIFITRKLSDETEWWYNVFEYSGIEKIYFEEGIETIHRGQFYGMNNLKTVFFPNSVKEIHEENYADCKSLETVYGYKGTVAEDFAEKCGAEFIDLSDVRGDANNDGVVSAADLIALIKYIIGDSESQNISNADLNDDGIINVLDAVRLKKLLIG